MYSNFLQLRQFYEVHNCLYLLPISYIIFWIAQHLTSTMFTTEVVARVTTLNIYSDMILSQDTQTKNMAIIYTLPLPLTLIYNQSFTKAIN